MPTKSILLGFLFLMIGISNLYAQKDSLQFRRHTFHAEIFGHGILYSVNYDFRFHQQAAFHVGFSRWGLNSDILGEWQMTAFPLTLIYLIGQEENHLEIGAGIMPVKLTFVNSGIFTLFSGDEPVKKSKDLILGIGSIGYRFQSLEDGLMLRLAITPFYNKKIVFYAGGSVGISF